MGRFLLENVKKDLYIRHICIGTTSGHQVTAVVRMQKNREIVKERERNERGENENRERERERERGEEGERERKDKENMVAMTIVGLGVGREEILSRDKVTQTQRIFFSWKMSVCRSKLPAPTQKRRLEIYSGERIVRN